MNQNKSPAKTTPQYFKFTTAEGHAFYLLSADQALRSAARCGGTYDGPVPIEEVRAVYYKAFGAPEDRQPQPNATRN